MLTEVYPTINLEYMKNSKDLRENWETVIDFIKIQKGGVSLEELLSFL